MTKYWFISYNRSIAVMGSDITSVVYNDLTTVHPFERLKELKENANLAVYSIIWFTEITKEQFDEYKDIINE